MKTLGKYRSCLTSIWRSEEGSALPFIGLGIFMMLAATGSAIDMGRAQVAQSRLQNSLDAAGLAAGADVSTTDVEAEVSKYFYANFPSHYMGSEIISLTAVPDENNEIINLAATGTVDTTFMQVFGYDHINISANSQITRTAKGLELVLVIDNTGSMSQSAGGTVTKIEAAKAAATDLVNILYGTKETIPNLWIGLVPFSQAVNVGTGHGSWTTGTFNWGTTSWAGCVDAREASGRDQTDDPPSTALFPKYYWPCDSNNQWYGTNSSHTNCTASGTGFGYKSGLGTTLGPNKGCAIAAVTPMTGSKTTMLNAIQGMIASGNTHIVLGAGWGWRMLSPNWRNLWGGEMDTNNLPLDYNTALMNKAVILMTDGDNTIDNSTRGAYWYLSSNKLGTTNSTTAVTQLNTRLQTVCTNMKSHGILVYTIALGTGLNSTSLTMLSNCASKPQYFFNSPTTDDLRTAFKKIGDSLANLRISQ